MAVTSQLRMYTINKGKMDEFIQAWRDGVVPLRQQHGFRIDGAWVLKDENRFVWILTYEGDGDWDAKNKAYYDSPERKTIKVDPSQFVAHMELRIIQSVLPK